MTLNCYVVRRQIDRLVVILLLFQSFESINLISAAKDDNKNNDKGRKPTKPPSLSPTQGPTPRPTIEPTNRPSERPSGFPSVRPTFKTTSFPTVAPASKPTRLPTLGPTPKQTTFSPSRKPSQSPSRRPTSQNPTKLPLVVPTVEVVETTQNPTRQPSTFPLLTVRPTYRPTKEPTTTPSNSTATNGPAASITSDHVTIPISVLRFEFDLEPGTTLDEIEFQQFLVDVVESALIETSGPAIIHLEADVTYDSSNGTGSAVLSGVWTGLAEEAPSQATFLSVFGFWGVEEFTDIMETHGYPVKALSVKVDGKLVNSAENQAARGTNGNILHDGDESDGSNNMIIAAVILSTVAVLIALAFSVLLVTRRCRAARHQNNKTNLLVAASYVNGLNTTQDTEQSPSRAQQMSTMLAVSPVPSDVMSISLYSGAGDISIAETSLFTNSSSNVMPPPCVVTSKYDPSRLDRLIDTAKHTAREIGNAESK